ncbi:MAG TPA: hypothetical protein ENK10_02635 [Acidobacteria bacterium]|nr:hypothetical protein [Acidobacteriota bacterium]
MGKKKTGKYAKVIWPGFTPRPDQRHIAKVGRNDPCPCGSGRKYKECHESAGSGWLRKIALEQDRKAWKARRGPWYRRLLFWGRSAGDRTSDQDRP